MTAFTIAANELRYRLRSLQTLLVGAVFFFPAILASSGNEFQIAAQGGVVHMNSPFIITYILLIVSVFATMVVPAFMGDAILRDVDNQFDQILFSTPISKRDYLLGRFTGAFTALTIALSGAPLGMFLGNFMPWTDPESFGPIQPLNYLTAYFGFVIPSLLVVSAIIFAVSATSRKMIWAYLAASSLLILYLVVLESDLVPPLLDPFMNKAFEDVTQYWTAAERNTRMAVFEGSILWNRLIWLSLSLLTLVFCYKRFSFQALAEKRVRKVKEDRETPENVAVGYRGKAVWSGNVHLRQLLMRVRFETWAVLKSPPFLILLGFCAFLLGVALMDREVMYGVNAHPVTRLLAGAVMESTVWALLAVFIFYSAEVIGRERKDGVHEMLDAMPAPNYVFVVSKLMALIAVMASVLALGICMAVALQIFSGYYRFEPGIYLEGAFFFILQFIFLGILACFFQVLGRGRLTGMVLTGLFMAVSVGMVDMLGVEHPLFRYGLGGGMGAVQSDMNGAGRFLTGGYWLRIYWAGIGGFLLMLTYLLWDRGTPQPMKLRLRALRAFKTRAFALPALLSVCLIMGAAGYIYYNTNVLNEYVTRDQKEALQVAYEREYRRHENLPMPRLVDIKMDVDLYPEEIRVEVRGQAVLQNKTGEDLSQVHLVFPGGSLMGEVALEGGVQTHLDDTYLYYIFELNQPMQPGEKRTLTFELAREEKGFPHRKPNTTLVRNGTFMSNKQLTPHIGFFSSYLLKDADDRHDHGLEPLPRTPKLEDMAARHHQVIRQDSDYVNYETTVSTSADQIAVAPGRLVKSWEEGDRRWFHYKSDEPIINFYAYLSADYTVEKERHGDVDIEIYYHEPHTYNVKRMMDGVKDSLDYFQSILGPYQHKHLRILEFPAYRHFAQSYPNTIPYSESMGFIADVKDQDLDMPYYVTAHEMAHQWWGMQLAPADVQGSAMLNETFSQYCALLVMQRKYGEHKIRKFLKLELDRYLSGRPHDAEGELPLYRVEDQNYIHYRKGSLIMYALRDYLGEEVVNRSLRELLALKSYETRPYAVSTDFLDILKREAGPEHLGLIEDFFEKITLYDVKVEDVRVVETADGRFRVSMDVTAAKFYADAEGREQEASFNMPVDIGLFLRNPNSPDFHDEDVVLLEKQMVTGPRTTLELVVDRKPVFAGADPYNKLIDRNPQDNLSEVEDLGLAVEGLTLNHP